MQAGSGRKPQSTINRTINQQPPRKNVQQYLVRMFIFIEL
jgi:hypothetical protein